MGLLLADPAKPNPTQRDQPQGGGGKQSDGILGATIFNNTKWDAGEGKANTPEDSSHHQKELLSCVDDVVVFNNFPSFGD